MMILIVFLSVILPSVTFFIAVLNVIKLSVIMSTVVALDILVKNISAGL
jgi:hypothetical protein